MKPGCGAAARTRPASPPSVTFVVQCPGRRGHRGEWGGCWPEATDPRPLCGSWAAGTCPQEGRQRPGGSAGPWRDGGEPTCGGDAVESHEGVEAGRGPRQDPREPKGQEAADAEPPLRAAGTESHSGGHGAGSWPQRRAAAAAAPGSWPPPGLGPPDPRHAAPAAVARPGARALDHRPPAPFPEASLSSDAGSGLRALRGPGVRQERGGPTATAPPPGTRRRSPGFPGDSGLKRAFLETLKGELFVSEAPLRPACVGSRMSPGWAGTQHSRAPGGHHALCQSSGHKIRPICEPRNPRK